MLTEFKTLLAQNSLLKIKVLPTSARTEIVEILDDNTVKIRVTAPPEKGKANKELIKFLSQELNTPKDNIKIISGQNNKLKLIKITL